MKRIFTQILFCYVIMILTTFKIQAQGQTPCLVNQLIINTGYNPVTVNVLFPGDVDTNWKVTALSPDLQAICTDTPVYNAYVIYPDAAWAANSTSAWISCMPADGFSTDSTSGKSFIMTLTRKFYVCGSESIFNFNIHIAGDNSIKAIKLDSVVKYSRPDTDLLTTFNSFDTANFSTGLSQGMHTISVEVVNYPLTLSNNKYGVNIYGTISTADSSLISYNCPFACSSTKDTTTVPSTIISVKGMGYDMLFQNYPNPSANYTTIGYTIHQVFDRASINIYDVSGRLVAIYPVTKTGHNIITINSGSLVPGIYQYNLIVDGKVIDTKKMVLIN